MKHWLLKKKRFLQSLKYERYYWCRLHARKNSLQGFSKKKKLGENHELYIQNDATLLADVFAIFKNICLEIYDVDPVKVLSVK